ncbi:MAG TPA: hypothetical protein DCM05_12935 [Elusimicrobia bacterium]|nr:hypothetical protein [Elusimicrobiota bacterium]
MKASLALLLLMGSAAQAADWGADVSASASSALQAFQAKQAAPAKAAAALKEADCGSEWVSVVSQDEETAALACEGFRRALGFMLARGYQPKSKLTIIAADRFPDRYREMVGDLIDNMHGFYDTDTREVYMKSLRWFMESEAERTPLGVGPSRELYVSYFAHEAGHHLSVQAFAKAPQLIARPHGEFISYALQLETMAEGLKNNLFKRFEAAGGGAFSSVESINGFAHDADPQSFAVKSYLFLKGPEGEKTLQGFMDAKIEPPAAF